MTRLVFCVIIGGTRYLFSTTNRTFSYARSLHRKIFILYALCICVLLYRLGCTHESIFWIIGIGQLLFLLDYRFIAMIGLLYLISSLSNSSESLAVTHLTYGGMYCALALIWYQGSRLYYISQKRFN